METKWDIRVKHHVPTALGICEAREASLASRGCPLFRGSSAPSFLEGVQMWSGLATSRCRGSGAVLFSPQSPECWLQQARTSATRPCLCTGDVPCVPPRATRRDSQGWGGKPGQGRFLCGDVSGKPLGLMTQREGPFWREAPCPQGALGRGWRGQVQDGAGLGVAF